jgi:hypothetical protein
MEVVEGSTDGGTRPVPNKNLPAPVIVGLGGFAQREHLRLDFSGELKEDSISLEQIKLTLYSAPRSVRHEDGTGAEGHPGNAFVAELYGHLSAPPGLTRAQAS